MVLHRGTGTSIAWAAVTLRPIAEPLIGDRSVWGHVDVDPVVDRRIPVLHPLVVVQERTAHRRSIARRPALRHVGVITCQARKGPCVPTGRPYLLRRDADSAR